MFNVTLKLISEIFIILTKTKIIFFKINPNFISFFKGTKRIDEYKKRRYRINVAASKHNKLLQRPVYNCIKQRDNRES